MSVIIRLQGLPLTASSADIRTFFNGLRIPDGAVHIVGGKDGDAFIGFATDEDARQAMRKNFGAIHNAEVRLFLSSRSEMNGVIEDARGVPQLAAAPPQDNRPQPSMYAMGVMTKGIPPQPYPSREPLQQSAFPPRDFPPQPYGTERQPMSRPREYGREENAYPPMVKPDSTPYSSGAPGYGSFNGGSNGGHSSSVRDESWKDGKYEKPVLSEWPSGDADRRRTPMLDGGKQSVLSSAPAQPLAASDRLSFFSQQPSSSSMGRPGLLPSVEAAGGSMGLPRTQQSLQPHAALLQHVQQPHPAVAQQPLKAVEEVFVELSRLPPDLLRPCALEQFLAPSNPLTLSSVKVVYGPGGIHLYSLVRFSSAMDAFNALKKDGEQGVKVRPSTKEVFDAAVDGVPPVAVAAAPSNALQQPAFPSPMGMALPLMPTLPSAATSSLLQPLIPPHILNPLMTRGGPPGGSMMPPPAGLLPPPAREPSHGGPVNARMAPHVDLGRRPSPPPVRGQGGARRGGREDRRRSVSPPRGGRPLRGRGGARRGRGYEVSPDRTRRRSRSRSRDRRERSEKGKEGRENRGRKRSLSPRTTRAAVDRWCSEVSNVPFNARPDEVKSAFRDSRVLSVKKIFTEDNTPSDKWVVEFDRREDLERAIIGRSEVTGRRLSVRMVDAHEGDSLLRIRLRTPPSKHRVGNMVKERRPDPPPDPTQPPLLGAFSGPVFTPTPAGNHMSGFNMRGGGGPMRGGRGGARGAPFMRGGRGGANGDGPSFRGGRGGMRGGGSFGAPPGVPPAAQLNGAPNCMLVSDLPPRTHPNMLLDLLRITHSHIRGMQPMGQDCMCIEFNNPAEAVELAMAGLPIMEGKKPKCVALPRSRVEEEVAKRNEQQSSDAAMARSMGPPSCVLSCSGFPPNVTLDEVLHFFSPINVVSGSVRMRILSDSDRPTGDCMLAVATREEAHRAATTLNGAHCRDHRVYINIL